MYFTSIYDIFFLLPNSERGANVSHGGIKKYLFLPTPSLKTTAGVFTNFYIAITGFKLGLLRAENLKYIHTATLLAYWLRSAKEGGNSLEVLNFTADWFNTSGLLFTITYLNTTESVACI
jgi:hypothetical protein